MDAGNNSGVHTNTHIYDIQTYRHGGMPRLRTYKQTIIHAGIMTYTCTHIYAHKYTTIHIQTHIPPYRHAYTHTPIYAYTHGDMHTEHMHTSRRTLTSRETCRHPYTYEGGTIAYKHTYIVAYIHTYIHTRIQTD